MELAAGGVENASTRGGIRIWSREVLSVLREIAIMTISKDLLDILACPKCKGSIHLNETHNGLICEHCRLLYEIRDDIPIMLIEEAKPLQGE